MQRRGRTLSAIAYGAWEIALTAGAFFAAVWIRQHLDLNILQTDLHVDAIRSLRIPALVIWIPLVWFWGLSRTGRDERPAGELWKVLKIVGVGTVLLFAVVFAQRGFDVSRSFILIFAGADLLALGGSRLGAIWLRHYSRKHGQDRVFVIVIGTGQMARKHAADLASHPEWGVETIGFLAEQPTVRLETVGGKPVLGSISDLGRIISEKVVDEVHVAVSRRTLERLDEPLRVCDEQGIEVRIILTQLSRLNSRVFLDRVAGLPVLTLASSPQDPVSLLLKRSMDILVSFVALVVAIPLVLIPAAILIKLTKGPIVFRQKRVGKNGRLFTLYKLRTMRVDAEELKESLTAKNEMDGPVFKIKNDPRITGVGRVLRKLSIDEVPQLWNVLRGDMSLVGPRPPIPSEVAKYERWHRRRLSMRPGITCIWQVSGRSNINFQRWMEMDLEYIDNWSLGLDFKILLKTIPSVFSARGAS